MSEMEKKVVEGQVTPGAWLASFFREIMQANNIGPEKLASLISDYVKKHTQTADTGDVERIAETSMHGNITAALSADEMSWKIFWKGLDVLQLTSVTLTAIASCDAKSELITHTKKLF